MMRPVLMVVAAGSALLFRVASAAEGESLSAQPAAEPGRCKTHLQGSPTEGCGTSGVTLLQTRNRITMLEASSALDEDEDIGADDAAIVNRSWHASGHHVGVGWCRAEVPAANWSLKGGVCGRGAQLKVLTYNLFWWNLYGQRGGNWGSASRLIADNGPFDILGFQECDDPWRVLNDGGLGSSYDVVSGHHATAIAYNKSKWSRVDSGLAEVAEDRPEQHWGRREVGWARLRSKVDGKVVFVVNHHGPLPVNTGGICGGEATAYQILKVFGTKARESDFKLLLGDLNAENWATTQATLGRRMHRAASNWVDAVFASCPGGRTRNLGNGGSDHDALEVVFQL